MMIILYALIWATVILVQNRLHNVRLSVFFVFNTAWLITLVLYEFDLSVFPNLDISVYSYLLSYLLMHNISYVFAYLILANNHSSNSINTCVTSDVDLNIYKKNKSRDFPEYLFWCWLLFLILFFYQINSTYGFLNYLMDGSARKILGDLSENENSNINISYYMFGSLYVLFKLAKWEVDDSKIVNFDKIKISVVMISLLLTAAKMNFIYLCMIIYFFYFTKMKKNYVTLFFHALVLVLVFYVFIVLFSYFTGKVVDENVGSMTTFEDIYSLGKATVLYPYDYLVGALSAFNEFYVNRPNMEQSELCSYMLRRIYQLASLFIKTDNLPLLPPHSAPFVNINGINTNVYTMHYHIVNDLGPIFAIFFAGLQGGYFAWLDFCKKQFKNIFLNVLFYLTLANSVLSLISFKFNDTMYVVAILIFVISVISNYVRGDHA